MTKRAREILDFYRSENTGVVTNLARMINHGRLAGTGRFVILPVDPGFEHRPARRCAAHPPPRPPRGGGGGRSPRAKPREPKTPTPMPRRQPSAIRGPPLPAA